VLWLDNMLVLLQGKHYIPDAAIALLLSILAQLFKILGNLAPKLSAVIGQFPSIIYQLHQLMGRNKRILSFIVCQKCYSVYEKSECVTIHLIYALINT